MYSKDLPQFFKMLCISGIVVVLVMGCGRTSKIAAIKQNAPVAQITSIHDWGNGVNFQPSYYNNGNPNLALSLLKEQTKINTIRLEIEPDKVTQAKIWISQIKAQGYNLVCTYHKVSVLGKDDAGELLTAAKWWKKNYSTLSESGSFIVNLMNEWGSHKITASAYASAYNKAISMVREVYNGPIIIDIPGWGQETYTAYQACKTSDPKITDENIILSAHIYPRGWNQGRNHWLEKTDFDDLSNSGKTAIIGEFGNEGQGSCDWSGCVDYAKSKGWLILGWCWNGDGGSMNMVSPPWASDPEATSFTRSSYFNVVYDKL
jgi:hypothetical protein